MQEAQDLYQWSKPDRESLLAVGLQASFLDDLPVYIRALAKAQAQWNTTLHSIRADELLWKKSMPQAYALRKQLLHTFRFAFKGIEALRTQLSHISNAIGHAQLFQDLNDLSVLGKANIELLTKVGFDVNLLDKATIESNELPALMAKVNANKRITPPEKELRNRVYTLLKERVDAIRNAGKYVCADNPSRLSGYGSAYLKAKNARNSARQVSKRIEQNPS